MNKVSIKEIAKVVNGATPSTKHPEYYNGGIIWITPKDLSDQQQKYIIKGERNITEQGYNSCSTEMIPANNILMSSRAPIGLLSINKVDCCTNQGFKSLVVNTEKCDVEYLYYYLKFHIKEIEALGSGTTFKEVSKVSMENYEISLPDMTTQKKVAHALCLLDDKIQNNNKVIFELESLAKTIYDYWFLQFEFPNEDGKPYKSSGGKMVWNEELKREIPEGWDVKYLSNICKLGNGVNYEKGVEGDHFYRIVNVRNISASTLLLNKEEMDLISLPSNLADRYLVQKNDILIARSGSPGSVRLIIDNDDVIYCGFIIHCLPFDENMRYFLTFSLKKYEGTSATKTGGSILQNVSQDTLKALRFPIPPKNVLKQFNKQIVQLINLMQLSNKENQELASLRDFLLPMLMNGQVTFKD